MVQRTVLVTGASDGVGAAAARFLANRGDKVVIVGRTPHKTRQVADEIGAPYYLADFADLSQVKDLAVRLANEYPGIDVLMNNAGAVARYRTMTRDGHELMFQVNHLAPFLLTTSLLPTLTQNSARVIATSSNANRFSRLDMNDLDSARRFSPMGSYGRTKLANILFTAELQRRYSSQGLTSAAFHPGAVASNFAAGSGHRLGALYGRLFNRFLVPAPEAADTGVWLATAANAEFESGGYYFKRRPAKVNRQANAALAEQLWSASAAMVAGH